MFSRRYNKPESKEGKGSKKWLRKKEEFGQNRDKT